MLTQIEIQNAFQSKFGNFWATGKNLGDLVSLFITASLTVSGVVVLVLFVVAGFMIVSGAGQNKPESVAKGKQAATSALIGFVIVFSAYWVIRVIELISGVDFITNSGI